MTIEKKGSGTTAEWKLEGWLDAQSSIGMEQELNALSADTTALILDCSELEYISSAGLRQFVLAHRIMKGELTVKNLSPDVMNVFRETGLNKTFRIE